MESIHALLLSLHLSITRTVKLGMNYTIKQGTYVVHMRKD